jgi:hypothetical protein
MKHYVIATAIVLSVFFFTLMDASPWITVGFVGIFTTMLVFHCDRQNEQQNNLEERIDEMAWAEEQIARLNKGGLIGSGPGEENAEDLMSAWDHMSNELKALTEPKKPSFDQNIRNCNPPHYIELETHDEQMTRLSAYQNGIFYNPGDR